MATTNTLTWTANAEPDLQHVDSHFSEYPEVLRHKIPHREPRVFTLEDRQ